MCEPIAHERDRGLRRSLARLSPRRAPRAALAGDAPLRAPAESCVWDVRVMARLIEIAEVLPA